MKILIFDYFDNIIILDFLQGFIRIELTQFINAFQYSLMPNLMFSILVLKELLSRVIAYLGMLMS